MVISCSDVEVRTYRDTTPLLLRKKFSTYNGPNKRLSNISQALGVYQSLETIFAEKAYEYGHKVNSIHRIGRSEMPSRESSNLIEHYQFIVDIPERGLDSKGDLHLYSDGTLAGNRNKKAIHGTLELRVHGNYESVYPQIASRTKSVSDIFFPEGMSYEGGWDLEKDGHIVRLGRSQLLL